MSGERDLGRRLRETPIPGEEEAGERSWEIVRTAYEERTVLPVTNRARRLTLALAGGAVLLAIGLSPAGAKVGDLVSDVVGIDEQDAHPALRSLPAAGELLVDSEQGPWIVREDGSKRLLGEYGEASWSPHGLFVAVTKGRELLAVDPAGVVRWTIPAPGPVHDPRWGGTGFDTRIAYRAGDDLWVVDGDGGDQRRVAADVAPVPPVWRPPDSELKVAPDAAAAHLLAYLDRAGSVHVIDVDTGKPVEPTSSDLARTHALETGAVLSPLGDLAAAVSQKHGTSALTVRGGGAERIVFSGPGRITVPVWSPDGRWLLFGWRDADQWLFVPLRHPRDVIAIDRISEQFDPGDTGGAGFPRVSGWILPQR